MIFYFDEEEQVSPELLDTMKKAAAYTAETEGLDPELLAVSVSFVTPEEIQVLNRDYRNTDRVTDVLSFPQFEGVDEIRDFLEMTGEAEIGDVVINKTRAQEQAEEFGHSLEREIVYLFVHSILHLLGYDHMEEEEKREMRAREEEVMNALGITREEA